MSIQKGNSSTHTFSDKGLKNYDNVKWSGKPCNHLRYIGKKRSICTLSANAVCPTNTNMICPIVKEQFGIN